MLTFPRVLLACILVLGQAPLSSARAAPPLPKVAIIIDDIGYQARLGEAAIELPGPFAVAIMPFAPHSKRLAALADASEKNVILHLPMEAYTRNHLLGKGALLASMDAEELHATVDAALASVPQAIGVNNHMGSLLTSNRESMDVFMAALAQRQELFFVDSKTTSQSAVRLAASAAGVTAVERHVFLDNEPRSKHIRNQLQELVKHAQKHGHALAIGHPYPATIAALEVWDPHSVGVELISLQDYIHWVSAKNKLAIN
jgi:uncharacterized protein